MSKQRNSWRITAFCDRFAHEKAARRRLVNPDIIAVAIGP